MTKTTLLALLAAALGVLGSCSGYAGSPNDPFGAGANTGGALGGEAIGGAPDNSPAGGRADPRAGGTDLLGGAPAIDNAGGQGGTGGEPSLGAGGADNTPTVRLATFNIQNFGPTKLGRPAVMAELADIVRRYPFVAVQEISDVNQEVPFAFLDLINADGAGYAMLLSPRSGQQAEDKTYQEQYAFYYDAAVMSPLSLGQLYDDSANDYFVREPYVAQFEAIDGGFTFVGITVHTQPDNTVAEIGHLADVVAWAQDQYPDEDDFIILGDLNAGCTYASPSQLDALALRTNDYMWIVPDTADTNLAMSQCPYDRIIVTSGTSTNYRGDWGIDSSFTNTMVSDHWPVWGEFWAEER
jgi:endonuclease/exonuclease/phosphatase family metal-dependent hydrolase